MALPNDLTTTDTTGRGSSAYSVNHPEIDTIMVTAITDTIAVDEEYMMAGPSIILTAPKSLVARDMRSPVR